MKSSRKPIQSEQGYQQLRRLLITSQILPGTRIAEVEWAQRLDVHRTALREAMRVLAHEGLLEIGQRGGFFVPVLTREDFKEILETRAIIETGAIRQLIRNEPTPETLEPLVEICDVMDQMLKQDLEFGFIEADRRFHETLVSLTGNSKLVALYRQAPLPIRPSPEINVATRYADGIKTIKEHRQLVELLKRHQTDQAIELLEQHLKVASTLAVAVI